MNETETSCLIVLLEKGKSFKPLKKQFQSLNGFYNGIGYVFPEAHELSLRSLVAPLNAKIIKIPLGTGETFESKKNAHKTSFFQERLLDIHTELIRYKTELNTAEISEKSILESNINEPTKQEIIELLHESERLKESIEWAKKIEVSLSAESFTEMKCADELLEDHNNYLEKYRGKEFIGLKQVTLPSLDQLTLGLRGNILLAAAPNVGKTALTIQIALDVLQNNLDACVVYLSLEMPKHSILSRIRCHLAKIDWDTLIFGSGKKSKGSPLFTKDEWLSLKNSDEFLKKIGKRFYIVTEKEHPEISVEIVLKIIEKLKKKTGCSRVFVILDYLQVWPIPESVLKTIRSDNEADKWRIGQLKILSESLIDDPVLSISEARKPPDRASSWGGEMSDIMGSARNAYTPDMVLLYRSILDKIGVSSFFKKESKPTEEQIETIAQRYRTQNCDLQQVTLRKGRDGMKRGSFFIKFYYLKNTFEEVTENQIKKEFDEMLSKNLKKLKNYYETEDESF